MIKLNLTGFPILLALAACQSEAPTPSSTDTAVDPAGQPSAQPSASAAPVAFQSMTYEEFSPLIESGLGCSFSADDETLLVATADLGEGVVAKGVVKLDGKPQVVTAQESGGYDALVDGATFSGSDGLSLTVVRTSDKGTPGEIETTSWPAFMTAERVDGGTARYEGIYGCGA